MMMKIRTIKVEKFQKDLRNFLKKIKKYNQIQKIKKNNHKIRKNKNKQTLKSKNKNKNCRMKKKLMTKIINKMRQIKKNKKIKI